MSTEKLLTSIGQSVGRELAKRDERLDALEQRQPEKGEPGTPGAPGVGIKAVSQDTAGSIILEFDDGTEFTVNLPPGEKGEPGTPGAAGLDAPLVDVIYTPALDGCERGALVRHAGGIFQAIRKTTGTPDDDPNGYRPLVNGIESIRQSEDWQHRERVTEARLSDGHTIRTVSDIPGGQAFSGFVESVKYLAGDWFLDDAVLFRALVDGAGEPEKCPEDWQRVELRGPRGRKGQQGEPGQPGEPGKPGVGIQDVYVSENGTLVTEFSNGRTKEIELPLILSDDSPGVSLGKFQGEFMHGRKYTAGDVVSGQGGLFVAKRANTGRDLLQGEHWQNIFNLPAPAPVSVSSQPRPAPKSIMPGLVNTWRGFFVIPEKCQVIPALALCVDGKPCDLVNNTELHQAFYTLHQLKGDNTAAWPAVDVLDVRPGNGFIGLAPLTPPPGTLVKFSLEYDAVLNDCDRVSLAVSCSLAPDMWLTGQYVLEIPKGQGAKQLDWNLDTATPGIEYEVTRNG